MTENKYFIPDISDLRVGYELEELFDSGWMGWKIHYKGFISYYYHQKILEGKIRTPYLTKEQIEAEGWVFEKDAGYAMYTFSKETDYPIPHWELNFNCEVHGITISSFISEADTLKRHYEIKYSGGCSSINEFRYICKLLKIK